MARTYVTVTVALLVSCGWVESGAQLVQDCGVAQPSSIVFPARQSSRSIEAFVVGGQPVRQEEGLWVWMVLLGERVNGHRRWTCGGTLISARTVLTAAHCVSGRRPSALTARLGEHDTAHSRDGRHTDVSVSRITLHPSYGGKQNDIALLRLSRPVTFSRRIQPACLPTANADHTGERAYLAGWGYTEFSGESPSVLHEVELTVKDEEECEEVYRGHPSFERQFPGGFQGTKLCASGADLISRDACQGDSGGPLVYHDTRRGRYQLIGVVSTGLGCGNPQYPGIYTKVSKYVSWIVNNSA